MLALDLLRVFLPHPVVCSVQMTFVGAPAIRVIARNAKRLQQGFQLQKDGVLASSKHIRQHLPGVVIDGVPVVFQKWRWTAMNADFRGQKMTHTFPPTLAEVMGT